MPFDWFPYETTEFVGQLEILDRQGRAAVFRRRQRVRFMENNVSLFMDRVWGDGVLFAGYGARELRIIDIIQARQGYIVLLALPRSFSKGETFEIVTERRMITTFTDPDAYWESTMAAPTRLTKIDVRKVGGGLFGNPHIVAPPRSRMDAAVKPGILSLRVKHPQPYIPYRLSWSWR